MSKETVIKKREALRTQITQLTNLAEERIANGADKRTLNVLQAKIKGIAANLKTTNEQIEQFITDDSADSEFERNIEYDMNIFAILSQLETSIAELTQASGPAVPTAANNAERTHPRDATELVKLPKLDLMKFDGNALTWRRFWSQYESAVHLRPNMSKGHKFNYLMSSVTGKAAAAIEGLQYSENNYDQAVAILKETFGNQEQSVDLHMNELLKLEKIKSRKETDALRKLVQTVQVHTLALESLNVSTECYAPMLMPVLKRVLPPELAVEFKMKEVSMTSPDSSDAQGQRSDSAGKKNAETLKSLLAFLREQVKFREETEQEQERTSTKERSKYWKTTANFYGSADRVCLFCNQRNHMTEDCCRSFTMEEKKAALLGSRACFRCTRPNHTARVCRSNVKCKKCKGRNATSMCRTKLRDKTERNASAVPQKQATSTACTMHAVDREEQDENTGVLLQTAVAWFGGVTGGDYARLLLDSGSQRSFISTRLAEKIGAKALRKEKLVIGSFGGDEKVKVMEEVQVVVAQKEKATQSSSKR